MNRDEWGRRLLTEQDIINLIMHTPAVDINKLYLIDPTQHNRSIDINFSSLEKIKTLEPLAISPADWHTKNQSTWCMPDEYKNIDIAKWVLDSCENQAELQRCGHELLMYAERNLLPLLAYLKYLVDTMKSNDIVWGVGRGSSVASFVLYKIGVHRINSLEYDLDFSEFMR